VRTCECDSVKDERKVAGLAGVVETARAIGFGSARAPYQQVGAPAAPMHFGEQALCVMRMYGAFESVKQQYARYGGRVVTDRRRRIEPMDFEEIVVRRFPALCPS